MPTIELVYDPDCPNVDGAREQLRNALTDAGLPSHWQEWNRADSESPAYARDYGSPTILVDGHDVADAPPSNGANSCRVYTNKDGQLQGIPSVEMITTKLLGANGMAPAADKGRWRSMLAVIPSVGAAALPVMVCPACWPAYAGLLSALGLGFIDYTPYLLPLMVVFLAVAIISLGYRARTRRGYKPLIVGIVAAAVVIIGKFMFFSNVAMYGGIALLVAASTWNSWPQQGAVRAYCPACSSAK